MTCPQCAELGRRRVKPKSVSVARPMSTCPKDGTIILLRRHGLWVAARWAGRGFMGLDGWWCNEADGWMHVVDAGDAEGGR